VRVSHVRRLLVAPRQQGSDPVRRRLAEKRVLRSGDRLRSHTPRAGQGHARRTLAPGAFVDRNYGDWATSDRSASPKYGRPLERRPRTACSSASGTPASAASRRRVRLTRGELNSALSTMIAPPDLSPAAAGRAAVARADDEMAASTGSSWRATRPRDRTCGRRARPRSFAVLSPGQVTVRGLYGAPRTAGRTTESVAGGATRLRETAFGR